MTLAAGTRLGPYEILAELGEGGMGEVYKARDTRLERLVAIKLLPPELSGDPERCARFEREARAIASIAHPHICTLYDIGTLAAPGPGQASLYLVMEYLGGETVAERLQRGALPLAEAVELGAQVADALDAAHRRGIVHRDLKPGNVMLTAADRPAGGITAKLLDFGIAKLAARGEGPAVAGGSAVRTQAAPVTAEGMTVGTLHYMAPEQLRGDPVDQRTDIFALGALLFEMIMGRRAFPGRTPMEVYHRTLYEQPPALGGSPAAVAAGEPPRARGCS